MCYYNSLSFDHYNLIITYQAIGRLTPGLHFYKSWLVSRNKKKLFVFDLVIATDEF